MLNTPHARIARWMVLVVPALLLGGAYLGQYAFGLYPCQMCWWQRWPHFVALALGLLSFVAPPQRLWIAFAAFAMLASGLIGAFHAGVEYGWWQGITSCSTMPTATDGRSALDAILATELVRCDVAPWSLWGVSLAGFNSLISCAASASVLILLATRRKAT